jgi:hypothetical protein
LRAVRSSNGQPITAGVEITPHTEITLQLDYRFTSDGAGNAGANGGFGAYEYLYAICPSEGTWAACFSDDRLAQDGWTGPGTRQETGTLTLSYFNDTDEYERLLYGANLETDGGISVAPVPEPASLSLFGLGLGLIGLGAMRRRKDKREA